MMLVSMLRAILGVGYIAAPQVLPHLTQATVDRPARVVLRVVGSYRLLHAVVTTAIPQRRTLLVGSAVDVLHSASMVLVSARCRRRAPATICDAAFAAALSFAGRHAAHRHVIPPIATESR